MNGEERLDLGRVGLWTFAFERQPIAAVLAAAAEADQLGYGAIWFGERPIGLGREAMTHAALLLAATRRIVVATGVANIFRRDAVTLAAAQRTLAEAFPNRFLLGVGGHRAVDQPAVREIPDQDRQRPVPAMRRYLDEMDEALRAAPPAGGRPRRVVAALGPGMLRLAAERAWGAHPYFVPVAHTALARETLGPAAFLAVEQAAVLHDDPAAARDIARAHVAGYFGARHQVNNLRRLGFQDADLAGGGSDRLVDALVARGGPSAIAERVCQHLDAGADHVCVQVLTANPGAIPVPEWRALAPSLL